MYVKDTAMGMVQVRGFGDLPDPNAIPASSSPDIPQTAQAIKTLQQAADYASGLYFAAASAAQNAATTYTNPDHVQKAQAIGSKIAAICMDVYKRASLKAISFLSAKAHLVKADALWNTLPQAGSMKHYTSSGSSITLPKVLVGGGILWILIWLARVKFEDKVGSALRGRRK